MDQDGVLPADRSMGVTSVKRGEAPAETRHLALSMPASPATGSQQSERGHCLGSAATSIGCCSN